MVLAISLLTNLCMYRSDDVVLSLNAGQMSICNDSDF